MKEKKIEQEIKYTLSKLNIVPTKNKGQNFLCNSVISELIVKYIGVDLNTKLLEIGPGLGVLTKIIVSKYKKKKKKDSFQYKVVEIEKEFCEFLKKKIEELNDSSIICSDICNNDLKNLFHLEKE